LELLRIRVNPPVKQIQNINAANGTVAETSAVTQSMRLANKDQNTKALQGCKTSIDCLIAAIKAAKIQANPGKPSANLIANQSKV